MKNVFKIVFGVIIAIAALKTYFVDTLPYEYGEGLAAASLMFVVVLALSLWLIYSGLNQDSKTVISRITGNILNKQSNLDEIKNQPMINNNEDNMNDGLKIVAEDDIQAKKNSLYELKESGILDEIEFEEKIKLLKEQKLNHLLQNSSDYKNLKVLFDSQILSKEEFENKTALLMVKVEENLNELEDLRKKIIGTWVDKIGTIEFTDDNNFTFKQKNNYVTKGLWFLKDLENIVIRINSREEFFNIRNLEENFFSYRHNDSIFKLNRL